MSNQFTTPPAFITCETCGTPKRIKPYMLGISKFCSRKCQGVARPTKHGNARDGRYTPEYKAWLAMGDRCRNPNNRFYMHYGERGISVCTAWNSFETFLADMGPRPAADMTLDRLDNNLGYSPENCAWRTRTHQQRNKTDTAYLTVNGETRPRIEWAELMGVNYQTLRGRLRRGLSPEQALGLEP